MNDLTRYSDLLIIKYWFFCATRGKLFKSPRNFEKIWKMENIQLQKLHFFLHFFSRSTITIFWISHRFWWEEYYLLSRWPMSPTTPLYMYNSYKSQKISALQTQSALKKIVIACQTATLHNTLKKWKLLFLELLR